MTSTRKIGRGESVVVDVVSYYAGYAADITRTFVMGRGGEVEKTYRRVLEGPGESHRCSEGWRSHRRSTPRRGTR